MKIKLLILIGLFISINMQAQVDNTQSEKYREFSFSQIDSLLNNVEYSDNFQHLADSALNELLGVAKKKIKSKNLGTSENALKTYLLMRHSLVKDVMPHILSKQELKIYKQAKIRLVNSDIKDSKFPIMASYDKDKPIFKYNENYLSDFSRYILVKELADLQGDNKIWDIHRSYYRIDNSNTFLGYDLEKLTEIMANPIFNLNYTFGLTWDFLFVELHELFHLLPENKDIIHYSPEDEVKADSFAVMKYNKYLSFVLDYNDPECMQGSVTNDTILPVILPSKDIPSLLSSTANIFDYLIDSRIDRIKDYEDKIDELFNRKIKCMDLTLNMKCLDDAAYKILKNARTQYQIRKDSLKSWNEDFVLYDLERTELTFRNDVELSNFMYNTNYYIRKGQFDKAFSFLSKNISKVEEDYVKEYGYIMLAKLYWSHLKDIDKAVSTYKLANEICEFMPDKFYQHIIQEAKIDLFKASKPSNLIISESQKIYSKNGNFNAHFGLSNAINEDYILVGTPNQGDCYGLPFPKLTCRGAVQVFEKKDGEWKNVYEIIPDNNSSSSAFGEALSLYNNYAIIGAPNENDKMGAAYILNNDKGKWKIENKILGSEIKVGDRFGSAVAIFDKFIAVGVPESNEEKGKVYIFEKNDNNFEEIGILEAFNESKGIRFGRSVSMYENTLAIGAIFDNENGEKSGSAYIYKYENNEWTFKNKILPSDGIEDARFGKSLSLYKNNLIVGAVFDSEQCKNCGSAYIFTYENDKWEEKKIMPDDLKEGAGFGVSVDVNEKYAIIGAEQQNEVGYHSGKAYVYYFDEVKKDWKLVSGLVPTSINKRDYFGCSVGIYNNTVLVGADFADGKSEETGAAFIYNMD